MPSDEALLQQAQDWKSKGNESFQKGAFHEAVSEYSQGVVLCDRIGEPELKVTLLSNRAMCYLKLLRFQPCIDDCTTALSMDPEPKLRAKLLFRRAKASFLLYNIQNKSDLLQDSAKDLLSLLQIEPNNSEAQSLLTTVRTQHKMMQPSNSPLAKALDAIQQQDNILHNIKILLGLLDNDPTNAPMELGRLEGVAILLHVARQESGKTALLAVQSMSQACSLPAFVRAFGNLQSELSQMVASVQEADLVVALLAVYARILLHLDRDAPEGDIVGTTGIDYTLLLNTCNVALQWQDKTVIRAVLDVLSTWTAGKDRDHLIRTSLGGLPDPLLPAPVSQAEIRAMTPQQLAKHRKRESEKRTRDEAWAYERGIAFVQRDMSALLQAATACDDHVIRREITVVIGRILAGIESDDKIKELVKPFLSDAKDDDEGLTIQEVYNEDEEEKQVEEETATSLETIMQRALITNALLLSKKEVGAWALGSNGWNVSFDDLVTMIDSGDSRAMCLASEVISAAATLETVRPMIQTLITNGSLEKLIKSADRDIRSGAASAITKLGLSDKSTGSDEGELISLLQGACDLLDDQGDKEKLSNADKKDPHKLHHFSSFATSSVERAVEMINYLVANTVIKEELCAGYHSRSDSSQSALERLVEVADIPNAGESLTGFGLASIFHNLAVTNLQLRKEAFEGKEMTMEQYDELQAMGKTEEEKELMKQGEDHDDQNACNERIRRLASANVPRALVTLTEGASEHTLEQLVLCMNRMATEPSVRGVLIQQGVLSACIKIEKNETPTDTDTMKKVIRLARHCIAKILVSTNPSLLTSAQRLGAVRPLIQLVRDNKASDLQQFEALLAITNIASSGDDAKDRIINEKGLGPLNFAMFSDHELVQRAATEAMCNLVPHKAMMDHLSEPDNLKLWLAFASDYEEHYECARAAIGCLAMASQDESIASELVMLEKFGVQTSSLLESGRLEIMHRGFYLVLNLVAHGGHCRDKAVTEGLVAFSRAYVENYRNNDMEELEFPEEERELLPITVDIAKKIVAVADESG